MLDNGKKMNNFYDNFDEFDNEEDYLDSLKKEDSYTLEIDFEYYKKTDGDDVIEYGYSTMYVEIYWDADQHGYFLGNYSCPDEDEILNSDDGRDLDTLFEDEIHHLLEDRMNDEYGIELPALSLY